jgi:anti-anti-sigma factor
MTLPGERDLADAPALRDEVDGVFAKGSTLVFDLSETTFIDSMVVSVIADSARRADEEGHRFIVSARPGSQPRRVLDLVEAGRFVTVIDDARQALD